MNFCNFVRRIIHFNQCNVLLQHGAKYSTQNSATSQEFDKLYKTIIIECRAHDRAVLNSFEYFTKTAAKELDVTIDKILEPFVHKERRSLLKSVHIYKKHRVQYEFRTYFKIFELKHLTGSTADTFLEYIQRNLPEGVAMKVTKHCIEKIPESILNLAGQADSDEQKSLPSS